MGSVNLGDIYASIKLDTSGLTVGVEHAKRAMASMAMSAAKSADQVVAMGRSMSLGMTAPIVAGLGLAAREFMGFERQMRNVNSISKLTEAQLGAVTEQINGLAVELGRMPQDLAKGLYDIASSGFQGAEGTEVLRAAAMGATAGLATTQEAAKSLTAVLNAYSMDASKAGQVSDVMFRAVDKGVVTFSELGANLGAVVATAAAANVPFEQIAAAFATMTRAGIDAAETGTALNRIIIAFLSPSKKLSEALQSSGYASGAAVIQAKGLAGAVEYLQEVTGGSAEELAQLGMDARALKAALSLARNEGREFGADLEAMGSAAGATQAALSEQSKSLAFQWDQMKASAAVLAAEVGETLAPSLRAAAEAIKGATQWMSGLDSGMKGMAVSIAAVVAGIGPLLVSAGLMTKVIAEAKIGWAAISAVMGGPYVWAAIAAAAVIYGVVKAVQALKKDTEAETKAARESARVKHEQAQKAMKLGEEYEDLSSKQQRSADESDRYKSIIQQIAELHPHLADQWDTQGHAIRLVADAYAQLAREAKAAYDERRRTALTESADRLNTLAAKRDELREAARVHAESLATGTIQETVYRNRGFELRRRKATPEETAQIAAEQRDALAQLKDVEAQMKAVNEQRQAISRGDFSPSAPTKKTPTNKTSTGTGTGDGKGKSAAERAVIAAQTEVDRAERLSSEAQSALDRAVNAQDLGKANSYLEDYKKTLSDVIGAYGRLQTAQEKVAETPEDKEATREALLGRTGGILERHRAAKEQVAKLEEAIAQSSAQKLDKINAETEQEFERRLDAQETARKATADAEIESARQTGNKTLAIYLEGQRQYERMIQEGVDPLLAHNVATANVYDELSRMREEDADDERRRGEEAREQSRQTLEYQLRHYNITTDAYVAALETQLAATEKYSAEYFEIMDAIEGAHASKADKIIEGIEKQADSDKEAAIASLDMWIEVYSALGDAGVEAVERLRTARAKLTGESGKDAVDWKAAWKDFTGDIFQSYADTLSGMILKTTSFADGMKQIWQDVVRFIVGALVKSALTGQDAFGKMAINLGGTFNNLFNWISKNLADLAVQAAGLVALSGKAGKKKQKWGFLGALAAIALGPITLGTALTGASIGSAIGGGFDNPINDTAAVRSGADFTRLFGQGISSEIGSAKRGLIQSLFGKDKGGTMDGFLQSLTKPFFGNKAESLRERASSPVTQSRPELQIGGLLGQLMAKVSEMQGRVRAASTSKSDLRAIAAQLPGKQQSVAPLPDRAADLGRAFPTADRAAPIVKQDNRSYSTTVNVTTHVEKVSGIEDVKRISEAQAWVISQRLRLTPTGS